MGCNLFWVTTVSVARLSVRQALPTRRWKHNRGYGSVPDAARRSSPRDAAKRRVTRDDDTGRPEKIHSREPGDINPDDYLIRIPRLQQRDVEMALSPQEQRRFQELRAGNVMYQYMARHRRMKDPPRTYTDEEVRTLQTVTRDYSAMLLQIRKRLVDAGQAHWQHVARMLPSPAAALSQPEFTPEELSWVLDPEERERFKQLLRGRRHYQCALLEQKRASREGRALTPEQEEELQRGRDLARNLGRMRIAVRDRLLRDRRCGPERLARWNVAILNRKIREGARRAGSIAIRPEKPSVKSRSQDQGVTAEVDSKRRKAKTGANIAANAESKSQSSEKRRKKSNSSAREKQQDRN